MVLQRSSRTASFNDPPPDLGTSDAVLVAQAKHGDSAAFALLYRRYVDRIYAFAARRLANRGAAEEATQEIFMRALAGLSRCREENAFAGWIFAIARNVLHEHYRSVRHTGGLYPESYDAQDPDPTPEERAVRIEAASELLAARERCLRAKDQELFDLLLADLTDAEIAVALGRRPGAVRTAHWRLLTRLRDCLGVQGSAKGGRDVAL
ncbi:MAG: RNA polymerase sigma factor [Thermomicrobiales bacterium]